MQFVVFDIALYAAKNFNSTGGGLKMAEYMSKDDVLKAIDRLPLIAESVADVQPVDRWISVNDRLPDVAEAEVLVWIDDGTADGIKIYNSLHIAYWYGDTKLFYDFHCDEIKGVTHWMYVSAIPEPTKDGDING